VVSIRNRRPVQNHIKGVHAAAMALLAETASGFLVGMNLSDDKLPLIKTLKVDYLKRTKGDMRAVATLSEEQKQQIYHQPKGEVSVSVIVTDESGEEPIRCEMLWAWVPKKRD
jgi:acyl-coenzyme A thioesterase PaaI-like protein